MTERIVTLKIEADEGSWHLHLSTDFVDYDFVLPADVALDLAETEASKIRSWLAEGQQSARERVVELGLADASELDNPEYPDYLAYLAGADLARDIERGK